MKKVYLFTLLILSVLCSFSQVKLDSGLVAYYPFNGNANDESGNGNNPIFNNATLTNDEQGNPNSAYNFNGIDQYIQIPNSPSLNMSNQISISLKVRPLGFYTGPCYNNMMVMKGDADYLDGNYSLRFADVITGCTTPTTTNEQFLGGDAVAATNPIVQLNKWYTVVWTYDGTIERIYVDCVLQDSLVISVNSFINQYDLFIGTLNNSQYPYWLNGDLDEVRIYNRALNYEEVSSLCPSAGSLSVHITSFATSVINNQVKLNWHVENEDGIISYSIQRSISSNSDFKEIGKVIANKSSSYSFIDNSVSNNIYFYRLKILENTNATSFSEIRKIDLLERNKVQILFTNPASGFTNITVNGYNGKADIEFLNSLGQLCCHHNYVITDGSPISISLKNLKGVYWLRIKTNNDIFSKKIILN